MAGLAVGAAGQAPAPKPDTTWTPYTKSAPTTAPVAVPAVPIPSKPAAVPAAPISTQPGLVPQTLSFQKSAEPTLPPLSVPAIPVSNVRPPAADAPSIAAGNAQVQAQLEKPTGEPMVKILVPKREDVFRLESDAVRNGRMQRELGDKKDAFPTLYAVAIADAAYTPKTATYPAMQAKLEPNYVIHGRLYFETMNTERGAWDLGALQPFISSGQFMKGVLFLPHNVASGIWRNRWDTSAGKCKPGDSTPLYMYPPGFTVSGLMWQTSVVVGLPFIFP